MLSSFLDPIATYRVGKHKYETKTEKKKVTKMKRLMTLGACLIMATSIAIAALNFDQIIVAIFGAGNPNTGWTTATEGQLTLALRAKNRETASTLNASGVYNEPAGLQAPNNNRARWNWEFSINSGNTNLNAYEYYMVIDLDPSTGVQKLVVNALTQWSDNSYGDSTTLNGQGVEGPAATYASSSSVAQQSQNIVFYGLDANLDATYSYELYAVAAGAGQNGARIATTAITVIVGAGGPPPPDSDNDGVPNSVDLCPGTIAGHAVDVNGCSIQDLINKCAAENSADHGEYVSCVVELANKMFKDGKITQAERKSIINAAAQSSIGK